MISQFTTHWSKDAGTSRLPIFVDKHSSVLIKSDIASIGTAAFFACPYHDASDNFTFFHTRTGNGIFDRRDEYIAYRGIPSPCTPKDANTQHFSST